MQLFAYIFAHILGILEVGVANTAAVILEGFINQPGPGERAL